MDDLINLTTAEHGALEAVLGAGIYPVLASVAAILGLENQQS
jgi:hypothetical protein